MSKITIYVCEAGPGIAASIGVRYLGRFRCPLLSVARILLEEGVDPATILAMRWNTQTFDALTTTVGYAAKLSVHHPDRGDSPRYMPFRPFERFDT